MIGVKIRINGIKQVRYEKKLEKKEKKVRWEKEKDVKKKKEGKGWEGNKMLWQKRKKSRRDDWRRWKIIFGKIK